MLSLSQNLIQQTLIIKQISIFEQQSVMVSNYDPFNVHQNLRTAHNYEDFIIGVNGRSKNRQYNKKALKFVRNMTNGLKDENYYRILGEKHTNDWLNPPTMYANDEFVITIRLSSNQTLHISEYELHIPLKFHHEVVCSDVKLSCETNETLSLNDFVEFWNESSFEKNDEVKEINVNNISNQKLNTIISEHVLKCYNLPIQPEIHGKIKILQAKSIDKNWKTPVYRIIPETRVYDAFWTDISIQGKRITLYLSDWSVFDPVMIDAEHEMWKKCHISDYLDHKKQCLLINRGWCCDDSNLLIQSCTQKSMYDYNIIKINEESSEFNEINS